MTQNDGMGRLPPQATLRRSAWIGAVWSIPLAALIFLGYLAVEAFVNRGIDIVVTFKTANGAKVGDTKVVYQGLEGGRVTKITLNPDGHRVDMTLRLDRETEPALNSNTTFWLIGESPNLGDISSVKAALAGVVIGAAPGVGGTPTRKFVALDEPPVVPPGTIGTRYTLTSDLLGSAKAGASVFYRGQEIGKVTKASLTDQDFFTVELFVFAPFDKLVESNSMFWETQPLNVEINDRGFSANVEHPGAILTGGVEMDRPTRVTGHQSPEDSRFTLYPTKDDAIAGPTGPAVPYTLRFAGASAAIAKGVAVRYMGFKVGEVTSVSLQRNKSTGEATVLVGADLYPKRFDVSQEAGDSPDERAALDGVLNQLLRRGYRGRLDQTPPVIGSTVISLAAARSTPATLGLDEPKEIPTISGGSSIDDLTTQLSHILAKVDAIPIESIGRHIDGVTANLDRLASSPQMASSLSHLESTLAQTDQMMSEVRPEVGPLVRKLDEAAEELTGAATGAKALLNPEAADRDGSIPAAIEQLTSAARTLRELGDFLNRHPEALIKGKGKSLP